MSSVILPNDDHGHSDVATGNASGTHARAKFSSAPSTGFVYPWEDIRRRLAGLQLPNLATTELFIVRHGRTLYNIENRVSGVHNTKLSDCGREEASRLASCLKERHIEAIFSSDLDRAVETAQIFRQKAQLKNPVIQDYRLREVNLGEMEGKKRMFIKPFALGDIDYRPSGGESYREAARRIASFLADLGQFCQRDAQLPAVAIFTHAGVMRVLGSFFGQARNAKDVFRQDFTNVQIVETNLSHLKIPAFWYNTQG